MKQLRQKEDVITDKDKIYSLRKEQLHKKWHTQDNINRIKRSKKPFPKFGLILIIYSVISLVIVQYGPWLQSSLEGVNGQKVETIVYKDFINARGDSISNLYYKTPYTYIHGIFEEDFFDIPTLTTYALIILFILGMMITIYGLADRKKDYEIIKFLKNQSYLYTLSIPTFLFIIISNISFIGFYLSTGHNLGGIINDFIESIGEDVGIELESLPVVTPPVPYYFVISIFLFLTIAFAILDSNIRTIREEMKLREDRMIRKNRIINPTKKNI